MNLEGPSVEPGGLVQMALLGRHAGEVWGKEEAEGRR